MMYKIIDAAVVKDLDTGEFFNGQDKYNAAAIRYRQWLAAGNSPQAADPADPPEDSSDSNNLDKKLKAVLLCVAQVGGLTPAQMKVMFKNKWDSLP